MGKSKRYALAILVVALFLQPHASQAAEVVTPEDIKSFGWEYQGEAVTMYVFLDRVYAAKHGTNRGRIGTFLRYEGVRYDLALFIQGFKSRDIKKHIGTCVKLSGVVTNHPRNTGGVIAQAPGIDIQKIEAASDSKCE